jgi:hypothetical protein
MNDGFSGGQFSKDRIWGVCSGIVTNRDDPEKLGRIKVEIPGLIDGDSNWAWPRMGAPVKDKDGKPRYRGSIWVPPVGADVYVQFVMGDVNHPLWEPGNFGRGEMFPEHEGPDVSVWGFGPFRLVIDEREGVNTATFKAVKEVNGTEESVIEFVFNAETNSADLWATTALRARADGVLDLDGTVVQVRGRKVIPTDRHLN